MTNMRAELPAIRVYYDHGCPLCRREMQEIKTLDVHDQIELVDCAVPDFQDAQAQAAGISQAQMMQLIHAKRGDEWLIGVDVFVDLYRRVGLHAIASIWSHRWLGPVLRWLYPTIARHRMLLSRLGLTAPYGWLLRTAAKRAAQRGAACTQGRCAS